MACDDKDCVFTPSDTIKHIATRSKVPKKEMRIPSNLLVTYQRPIYDCAKRLVGGACVDWWTHALPLCVGEYKGAEIGVNNIYVGAPAAAMTLEELIACGARTIFEVGMCGGLQAFLQPGDIVIPTEAIRDEGTSYHYLPSEDIADSSEHLRRNLIKQLNAGRIPHHVGRIWSTDGVYRETRAKFRRFRDSGVLGVNMETSAIFAVAEYRNVEAASAQVVSDILTEREWQIHFFSHQNVRKNLGVLTKAVLETLSQN
ncbi:MAG: nucleoside phosphorylase [Candidatus Bathyarchaeota archaeon]|nr:nucleoside phosphorylase [Candidatus Bathyarchaeota archaeon]